MSDQLFYLFSAVLLGLVIGALIMYFISGSNKSSEKTIIEMEKKLNSYQNEVAEHFEQTADLVDGMTQSYKKVFDHLGKSARLLMTDEQIQQQIEKRKGNKVILEYLTDNPEDHKTPKEKPNAVAEDNDKDSDNDTQEQSQLSDIDTSEQSNETDDKVNNEATEQNTTDESNQIGKDNSLTPNAEEEISTADSENLSDSEKLEEAGQEVLNREKNLYT